MADLKLTSGLQKIAVTHDRMQLKFSENTIINIPVSMLFKLLEDNNMFNKTNPQPSSLSYP